MGGHRGCAELAHSRLKIFTLHFRLMFGIVEEDHLELCTLYPLGTAKTLRYTG
jgi:hypothetical protein